MGRVYWKKFCFIYASFALVLSFVRDAGSEVNSPSITRAKCGIPQGNLYTESLDTDGLNTKVNEESETGNDSACLENNKKSMNPSLSQKLFRGLHTFYQNQKKSSLALKLLHGLVRPIVPLVLFLTLSVASYLYMRVTRVGRMLNKLPGGPLLPFIGNAYMFFGRPESMVPTLHKYTKRYGGCFRFWKLFLPYVALVEPRHVEKVLSSSKHIDKGRDYEHLHWMNGEGLITSGGSVWREDRRIFNPAFKDQNGFLKSFNKNTKILMEILSEMTSKEVYLHPVICRCTMDTVFEGVLGKTFNVQQSSDHRNSDLLYDSAKRLMKSYRLRTLKPWLVGLPFVWKLIGMTELENDVRQAFETTMLKVIEERKKLLESGLKEEEAEKPFIDVLLGSTRSDKNLVDHAFTIFAAGFETNATGMEVALFMLALNPEHQGKVHEELDRVFNGDRDREINFADLSELTYLEMCIKESMRLYPPAPLLTRTLHSDLKLDNGMILPKGCETAIFVHQLHRDSVSFPDPEVYDPERFLPENCAKRHQYAYIPFSRGPRSCIGQRYAMLQMKVVLAYILRTFSVSTTMEEKDVNFIYGIVMELDTELKVTLEKRL